MKVAVAITIALCAVGALVVCYLAGVAVGRRRNYDQRLRDLGLNKRSAAQFVTAAKILNRMDKLIELDGENAADRLSPETRKQVADWAISYRIGVSQ